MLKEELSRQKEDGRAGTQAGRRFRKTRNDSKNVIVEIRGRWQAEKRHLFAAGKYTVCTRKYAESHRWKTEIDHQSE